MTCTALFVLSGEGLGIATRKTEGALCGNLIYIKCAHFLVER